MNGIWVMRLFEIVFAVVGVAFLIAGKSVVSDVKKKRLSCTQKVTATIIEVRKELEHLSTEIGYSWHAIFEYTVNGQEVRKRDQTGSAKPKFEPGQKICLYVNPKNIEEYYWPEEKEEKLGRAFMIMGAGILFLSVVVTVLGIIFF